MNGIENARRKGPGALVKAGGPVTTSCSSAPGETQDLFAVGLEMSAGDWIGLLEAARRIFGQAEARILWRSSPLPQPPELPLVESRFVEQCIDRKIGCSIRASALYQHYCTWCRASGYEPIPAGLFGRTLTRLGFTRRRSSGIVYENVRFRQPREVGE